MAYDAEMKELQDAATAAGLNDEIWWVMRGHETRPKYVDAMNRYIGYFHVAIAAHFAAMVLALYRLYETRPDTHNIPAFIDRVESDGALTKADADSARAQCAAIKPLWIKVSILRNNIYGHRVADMTVEEVFGEAGVSPFEFRDLVARTKELLNELNLKLRDATHAFNLTATRDTIRMLDALK
jgi:HEPN superfamily AbiU2-like protein